MIVIIDYQTGNIGSIANMFKKIGAEALISSQIDDIRRADKLVLPGVGAFDTGVENLRQGNLLDILEEKVIRQKTPILGICLGMQLFSRESEEGQLPGLGWIDAQTVRFRFEPDQQNLKIPHMGWNQVKVWRESPLFSQEEENPRFYFVHSYHVVCRDPNNVLATSHYGYEFTSAVIKDNIAGCQFHPEKSHKFGMRLFTNFVEHF
jgi:glutamine amidotransferase